jgi:dUTPase
MCLIVNLIDNKAKLPRRNNSSVLYDLYSTQEEFFYPEQIIEISTGLNIHFDSSRKVRIHSTKYLDDINLLITNVRYNSKGELTIELCNMSKRGYKMKIGDKLAHFTFTF